MVSSKLPAPTGRHTKLEAQFIPLIFRHASPVPLAHTATSGLSGTFPSQQAASPAHAPGQFLPASRRRRSGSLTTRPREASHRQGTSKSTSQRRHAGASRIKV